MAISQTMSNPNEWIQFYQNNNFSNITQSETPPTTNTTAATTTTTTTTASSASSRNNNNLSPDQGRVSKPPLRRRSRTSRRTPTTLLNTDTANFRAMVQQFTGAPTPQFAQRPQLHNGGGGGNFSFTQNIAPAGGFHVQYPNQQPNMLLMNNYAHGGSGGGGGGGGVSSHAPPGGSSSGNDIQNYENYRI